MKRPAPFPPPLRLLLCLLVSLLALAPPAWAQPAGADAPAPGGRPRIGLVLSGGGARGLAHIGVLKVLEELQIPVDIVVGTSMGAVVGGAYAAGRSTTELEALVQDIRWDRILATSLPRQQLSSRRREDDTLVPSRIEFGVNKRDGILLPQGAAGNGPLEATLTRLLPADQREQPLRRLAIPFRAVATDLLSGEMLDQADTPLFQALRASMAVPGVFAPLRVNDRPRVDGGLVRNLLIELARELGAEIIIAVNVGSPLLEERQITGAVSVVNQMLQILTEQNVKRSLRDLRPRDVLIDPDLGTMSFMDFSRAAEAIATGRRAALAASERLAALAAPGDPALARLAPPPGPKARPDALPLGGLEIVGTQRINPEALRNELGLTPGQPVSDADIDRTVVALHGRGDFERIEADSRDVNGQRFVHLQLSEAPWSENRIRIGLELYSNFAEANRFSLVALHVADWLNSWGAEWRTLARIGSQRSLQTEFWQPLGPGSPWFAAAGFMMDAGSSDNYVNGLRTSRTGTSSTEGRLSLGRRLPGLGEWRVGIGRSRTRVNLEVPEQPDVGTQRVDLGQRFAQINIDTVDSLAFPSRGVLLSATYQQVRLTGDQQASATQGLGLMAFRLGEWAGHIYGEAAHAVGGQTTARLGGYLRLSGTTDGSLQGENMGLARLVMARRLGELPIALGGTIRVGFSIETGAVGGSFGRLGQQAEGGWRQAGAAFVAIDTRFGPFHLALGSTRNGGSSLYLYLGPTW